MRGVHLGIEVAQEFTTSFCQMNGAEYLDYSQARSTYGTDLAFHRACLEAIKDSRAIEPYYDALLIDEAQDFRIGFFRLCHEFLKSPKRLVYCYDELQNLKGASLLPPEDIFGRRMGQPVVTLTASGKLGPNPDVVLPKCYRTPGPVLAVAHAIGFGIYRHPTESYRNGSGSDV